MSKRHGMSKHSSKRSFSKHASKTHHRNMPAPRRMPMRGGIRL